MWKHPPGDEIYRKGSISVFEVDGKKNKVRGAGPRTSNGGVCPHRPLAFVRITALQKALRKIVFLAIGELCLLNNNAIILKLGLYLISLELTDPHVNSVSLLPDLLPKPVPVGQAFSGPQDLVL